MERRLWGKGKHGIYDVWICTDTIMGTHRSRRIILIMWVVKRTLMGNMPKIHESKARIKTYDNIIIKRKIPKPKYHLNFK